MRIHKAGILSGAAAAVFLALCAYLGAALFGAVAPRDKTARVYRAAAAESVKVRGIIIREEQVVCSSDVFPASLPGGLRLPANTPLCSDGSDLTPCTGVYYPACDGYESLSPAELEDLTPDKLRELLAAPPEKSEGAKLITGFAWYFAALAEEDALSSDVKQYTLDFGDGETQKARLLSLSEAENGERAAVFRLTGSPLPEKRLCTAQAVFGKREGLCVPASAVRLGENGEKYVLSYAGGDWQRVDVDIIFSDGESCLAAFSRTDGGLRDGSTVLCADDTK